MLPDKAHPAIKVPLQYHQDRLAGYFWRAALRIRNAAHHVVAARFADLIARSAVVFVSAMNGALATERILRGFLD
ncbi:hypothetical protein FNL55_25130 [Tardiphaga sp. vice352]|uniref:hypothetical protein n=1 Tax=Tardiphaga sp. vice154 TaxID=2592814 RepID=UPI0011641143|nr:hypothetical protein [Tardiphaga sp. vice154]QDM34274.1 hypothetical protein FNL55_25130 [Tardiphaga sp. vice352]